MILRLKTLMKKIRAQKSKNGIDKVIAPGDRNLESKSIMSDDIEVKIDADYEAELIALAKA